MNANLLVETQNVRQALGGLNYLLNRPSTEMCGLGLIWGRPGSGKTRFAERYAIEHGCAHIRLEATTTAKTFARSLNQEIREAYGLERKIERGGANAIYRATIDLLNELTTETGQMPIIFIDEIDYAFGNKTLLGAIRDIADETIAVVILIGMEKAKMELQRANAHYFDRCSYFCEFKALHTADIKAVCESVLGIKCAGWVITRMEALTKGTLRKIMKLLYAIDTIAIKKKLKEVDADDDIKKLLR